MTQSSSAVTSSQTSDKSAKVQHDTKQFWEHPQSSNLLQSLPLSTWHTAAELTSPQISVSAICQRDTRYLSTQTIKHQKLTEIFWTVYSKLSFFWGGGHSETCSTCLMNMDHPTDCKGAITAIYRLCLHSPRICHRFNFTVDNIK